MSKMNAVLKCYFGCSMKKVVQTLPLPLPHPHPIYKSINLFIYLSILTVIIVVVVVKDGRTILIIVVVVTIVGFLVVRRIVQVRLYISKAQPSTSYPNDIL